MSEAGRIAVSGEGAGARLVLAGQWTLSHHSALRRELEGVRASPVQAFDASALGALDTAGAALLLEAFGAERARHLAAALAPPQRALLTAVIDAMQSGEASAQAPHGTALGDVLEHIGHATVRACHNIVGMLGFVGMTLAGLLRCGVDPRRWRFTSLVANLERTGFDAVPIVVLLNFLVGAVVAFLGATVLQTFGATIYTVHLVAFAFLREFGVMLAAIMVAGRTASAFAAQIGSMRANEEIDAIRTLGLDPVELLVLPRVWALMLALPMLTFLAMLAGLLGGLMVCMFSLGIPMSMYINIIGNEIGLIHFVVGMAKAPLFAFLIAIIGCMEGFKVEGSAQSVGEHTTSAVVQSIFVVILFDAIAALVCMEMGW